MKVSKSDELHKRLVILRSKAMKNLSDFAGFVKRSFAYALDDIRAKLLSFTIFEKRMKYEERNFTAACFCYVSVPVTDNGNIQKFVTVNTKAAS